MECLFCGIASGKVPTNVVYEDEKLIAFRDIQPQAPTHLVIIPKAHIFSLNELRNEHQDLLGKLVLLAKDLANKERIASKGYRLTVNCGNEGGQVIPHLHFHLLGGRKLNDWLG